ncbi:aminotransferase, partial [Coprobacillus cateniformis]|nr:aminotransferase [Coprobacillus cateniformis]
MNKKKLERLHEFEDVMNMEKLYNKTTEEIIKQYYFQTDHFIKSSDQGFQLTSS